MGAPSRARTSLCPPHAPSIQVSNQATNTASNDRLGFVVTPHPRTNRRNANARIDWSLVGGRRNLHPWQGTERLPPKEHPRNAYPCLSSSIARSTGVTSKQKKLLFQTLVPDPEHNTYLLTNLKIIIFEHT